MGKRKECGAPAGEAPKFTRRAIAAALPAPVFLITAALLFFFMALPVGEERGLNYYNLHSVGLSPAPMIASAVCAALLFLCALAQTIFNLRGKSKDTARLIASAICALLCMGTLTAACALLTMTGFAGHPIGPAPLLCIVFPLIAILNAAFCELCAL